MNNSFTGAKLRGAPGNVERGVQGHEGGARDASRREISILRLRSLAASFDLCRMASHQPAFTVGQHCTATITDIAFGGEGVARVNDFVVFVPFVLTGEEVELEIVEVKKSFARGKLVRVVQASPQRVQPRCRYFGACGGCQYQHLEYAEQLAIKRKQVADLFERVGGFFPQVVAPVLPCPQPYGYRNRIMVRSQWNKPEQKLNIGFVRGDCGLVEDIEECVIAEPAVNEQIQRVRANPPPKGGLKAVLRVVPNGWEVPPDSFFQNNTPMLPQLVEVARDFLRQSGSRFLVDAYCGVGFFALELADLVESYLGIEYDRQAIKAARRNALSRQRPNGDFLAGRTEDLLTEVLDRLPARQTTLVLDPPRTGCTPDSRELLRRLQPAQLIHISCHPATLARDLNVLCAEGVFELRQLVPLDMFPQTQHVECVADLRARY
jgi:tRNA/tmRNA/rRNA uracil-C5-methylase (TrmA/RlmC/RlmD family)